MLDATLNQIDDSKWSVKLNQSDPGIAAGQSVIFYWEEICYGAAVID